MEAVPSTLWEWLSKLDDGERLALSVVVVIFSMVAVVVVTSVVATTIRGIYKQRLDDALKRELLDRGMSAEEIERVVAAKSGGRISSNTV